MDFYKVKNLVPAGDGIWKDFLFVFCSAVSITSHVNPQNDT